MVCSCEYYVYNVEKDNQNSCDVNCKLCKKEYSKAAQRQKGISDLKLNIPKGRYSLDLDTKKKELKNGSLQRQVFHYFLEDCDVRLTMAGTTLNH